MRIGLSEDEKFRGCLILQVVPLVRFVVVHLHVLGDFVSEHHVCCRQLIGLNAGGIAKGERPVSQWPPQRFPDTVRRLECHVTGCEKERMD